MERTNQANDLPPLSAADLAAEAGTALPDKEVYSLLDLNVDLDLGLDLAAPIDLAVAANANVAAPIDAAVGANVLSHGSTAQAMAEQAAGITQGIHGNSVAHSHQDSGIDQSATDHGNPAPTNPTGPTTPTTPPAHTGSTADVPGDIEGALNGGLLNVDANIKGDLNLTAPINGAVAAQANVAAPIDAAVSANIGSDASQSAAVAHQTAVINQDIQGNAEATGEQSADIHQ
ncbi:hypothetical protein [Actinokineospora inagensis]|uniref:hypothetical protein n=1 Tax=Actinokineospora inagensis TaxID=103730 RepID=UPI0004125256|nr:hypothetical protein [Actinokineospora inagensis]